MLIQHTQVGSKVQTPPSSVRCGPVRGGASAYRSTIAPCWLLEPRREELLTCSVHAGKLNAPETKMAEVCFGRNHCCPQLPRRRGKKHQKQHDDDDVIFVSACLLVNSGN